MFDRYSAIVEINCMMASYRVGLFIYGAGGERNPADLVALHELVIEALSRAQSIGQFDARAELQAGSARIPFCDEHLQRAYIYGYNEDRSNRVATALGGFDKSPEKYLAEEIVVPA